MEEDSCDVLGGKEDQQTNCLTLEVRNAGFKVSSWIKDESKVHTDQTEAGMKFYRSKKGWVNVLHFPGFERL